MKKSNERVVVEEFMKSHPDFDNNTIMDYMEIYFKYDRVRVSDIISKIKKKEEK